MVKNKNEKNPGNFVTLTEDILFGIHRMIVYNKVVPKVESNGAFQATSSR